MKKKGVGIAAVLHPTGNKGAGDPSNAAIQLKPDGTLVLLVGAVDLGQGSTTILRQFAADLMEVPIEHIFASNFADDFAPLSLGSFASRVTLIDPHAVANAAEDLKTKIREYASDLLEAHPDDLEYKQGKVSVKGAPDRSMTLAEIGGASMFGGGADPALLVGTGAWQPARFHPHDPETGEMVAVAAISFGCCIVEIEVDTETGVVDVTKMTQVWEVGKAVNPLLVRQQITGGTHCGLGTALIENAYPYYPDAAWAPANLSDYALPTFLDYPDEFRWGYAEVPHPVGVFGAKGFSEGSTNGPPPAIMAAIHDAIGVWIDQYPATPEVILQALAEKA
ncbi:MAG TPA: molybdopterin cofactor-binding domain-containing protein [Anaerolineae bacterium]|nr:molybdopterin cofactor-binding domain-containing protein [Anaerolineae bacterium]